MKFSKQQQQELLDLVESARAKENDDSTTRIIALIEHQYKIYVGNQVGEKEVDKAKQQLLNDVSCNRRHDEEELTSLDTKRNSATDTWSQVWRRGFRCGVASIYEGTLVAKNRYPKRRTDSPVPPQYGTRA
jgi:hypothetical protein